MLQLCGVQNSWKLESCNDKNGKEKAIKQCYAEKSDNIQNKKTKLMP